MLGVALSAVPANAQGVVGAIVGYVYDANGMPIKGVAIEIESPTQIGGTKKTYSNGNGEFRLPGLNPGVFKLTAKSQGLNTFVQKGISVGTGSPVELTCPWMS